MRNWPMKSHGMKMTFFFIRQETFHVFQCAGNFSLAMAFHDRDIDHKIHLFRTFANLKFHITTLHRHAFFLLRIDKRNAVLFRKHTVSTDLKRFLRLISDPRAFHDLKVSKSVFLKIFDDPRNHLRMCRPSKLRRDRRYQIWLNTDETDLRRNERS